MIKRFLGFCLLFAMLLSTFPVAQGAQRGVSITNDKDFFAKLNLTAVGLEKVKSAVDKGNYTTAKAELLTYYQKTFENYEAEPFSGTSHHAVFMAMNDVWAFSENYINGVEVTATSYTPYTLDLGANLNGIYVLDQIYATVDGVGIATSESNNPPRLELYGSDGTLLKTITATEDTAVRPGKDLSAGLGTSTVMFAKHWPDTKNNLPYSSASTRCYVRFDTTQIPSNTKSAKLTVYCKRSPGNSDKVLVEDSLYLCVFQSYCTNWSEETLTWDSLVSGNYVGHYSYDGLEGGFDWKKPKGTPSEWLNYNTRFYEVRGLVLKGTEATDTAQRDSYMKKAKELVLDFVNDAGANTPAKRALEPANRLIEFPFIYKHLICGGYITADENVRILSWLYDDTTDQHNGAYTLFDGATATAKSNLPYTNWGLWHLTGFYSALCYFPEFTDAPAWKAVYDARLGVVMGGIIKDDGSYNEVTFGYPGSVISWCATLKKIMNQFGDKSENAAMFTEKMLLLTKYLVDCSLPTGKPPAWGEGGPAATINAVNTTLEGLTAEELQTELAKYLRNYQNANYGIAIDTMAQYDGIKVVTDRTGWGNRDSMIFMNAKAAGSHSHRDALALLFQYEGRNLLTDTGMTSYDGAHQHFAFQRSSTRSHNTIEIDGIAQTLGVMVDDGAHRGQIAISGNSAVSTITSWSTASNTELSSLKVVGTTTTNATHSTTFTHSRDVSFLKELGSILVVTDKVEPQDNNRHSYTQNWHSQPYSNPTVSADAYLTGKTAYDSGANLIIAQAGAGNLSASLETGYDASTPATPTKYFQYSQSAAGAVTYQTLLYPVSSGETATVAPQKITMANTADTQALAMEIAISDTGRPELATLVHYHSFEDTATRRTFGSYSTDAVTAISALDQEGKAYFASLAQGSSLTQNGIPVLQASGTLTDLTAVYENGVLSLYSEDPSAQGMDYIINLSGQVVTEVLLNDAPMTFTQKADGTVETYPAYVLLDFTEDSMASQTAHWNGLRATAQVDREKGILFGRISGGDPNVRMTTSAEKLGYQIVKGDIIELRMKTTITEGTATGVQVFFSDGVKSYSESYSCKNLTLDHATGRYTVIQLPFTATASYVGTVIEQLRVDMLNINSGVAITADYEIDYIYLGPAEYAPSASAKPVSYLYFNFGNKTIDEERYSQEAYGGYPYDLACWGYNIYRNTAPVIDNEEGTLSVGILPGVSQSYVQTGDFSDSLTAEPLYYLPKEEDTVQVRVRFEHCKATTEKPKLMLYFIRDNMAEVTNDHSTVALDPTKIESGEYMVVEFPVHGNFASAECINAIRFTVTDVEDDGTGMSRIVFDYFYVGDPDTTPIRDRLYFGFSDTEEDRERYSMNTYGGYNFDAGCWGVNASRANTPVIDSEEGTMAITMPKGSNGPYFQTTTGVNNLTTMPLIYFPKETDVIQLRVKFRNCTGTSPYLCLYYIKDNSATVTSNNSKILVDTALLNGDTYTVVTFPVPSGYKTAEVINSIRITMNGVSDDGSGKGQIVFDYIYLGPEEGLPTARYTVKFLNEDGTVLETATVHDGESLSYSGAEPTKAPDETGHYTFKGWDKALTDIKENMIVTATYTVAPHSLTYSSVDGKEHKASCACGYAVASSHSWGEGKVTSNTSCTEEGTMTYTCTLCDAVKNIAIPAYGHSYTSTTTAPTCTAEGYTTYTCVGCSHSYTDNKVPAKGHAEVIDKAVAPTCTATGLTEGKHCSVCDQVLTAQETVLAIGHAPVYTIKDDKTHIITCENCDFTEEAPHSYEDGTCICGHVEVKEPVLESTWKLGHSLNLASDISINYAIQRKTLEGYDLDSIYILAEIDSYKDGKYSVKEVKILPVVNGSYYYFTLSGLTAVNMNDEIRAVLYGTKDGQVHYSPIDTYSIATYAYAQLSKASAPQKLKVLCAELLRYGAKAQIFKSYRLDALVDAKMTEEQKALLSDMEAVTFGNINLTENIPTTNAVQWLGKSLDLASKVSVKFIFSLGSYTGSTEDLTMKVTYKDVNGKDKEKIITDLEVYNASRGYYAFTLDSLLAAELRSVLTVQILSGDTVVSGTLQYAADTYGNGKTDALGDLCRALFAYSDSACRYFVG